MYTVVDYLWFFFIYAFAGWVVEVCFQAIAKGKFENRGFLNGPICPIYGLGVCAVVLCLTPLKYSWALLFAGSVIVTSALELVTGFLMERIFHQRWWDYSRMWGNIGGFICPLFSLIWGLACTILIKFIHVPIAKIVTLIPAWVSAAALSVFLVALVIDVAATAKTMMRLEEKLKALDKLASQIHESSQRLAQELYDKTSPAHKTFLEVKDDLEERKDEYERRAQKVRQEIVELKQRYEELMTRNVFGETRIFKAFPNLRSSRYSEQQEKLKERIRQAIKARGYRKRS
jgi:uncharacterized membrane protein